jgi:thymidylate synthase
MTELVLNHMGAYPTVLRRILQYGERRSPRGLATFDLGFTTLTVLDARGGMPLGLGRKLNPAIGAVEAAQLIAGVSDPELVLRLAPQFERYSDTAEDGTGTRMFWGAYGERIKLQAHCAIEKLTTDPNTRQAVITLWDPWLDNVPGKRDYPCTIALHFYMHHGLIDMNVIMRSNDAWLGLPYDVFQFTQLQECVARALGTTPGTYRHTALSLHLYERDAEAARELIQQYTRNDKSVMTRYMETFQPTGMGRPGDTFSRIMDRAQAILVNDTLQEETTSERWYREQLHGQPANVG